VVGKIRDVTASTAQVLEISDPTSAAGVVLEQTRTRGIVRGNAAGQPEIVDMMPDSRIQPGQLVITSGGDQIFPRGLPIGTVLKIIPDDQNPPLVNVILKPAANLGRLEEVLVVTKTDTTPSATARADLARSESTAAQLKANAAAQAAGAAEAALETQSAADVLAARLPSATDVTDPDAPDAAAGSGPTTANESGPALHPPAALHPDHYSPGDTPAAQELTPGQRAAPYLQGKIPTVRVTPQGQGDALQEQQPGVSAAFLAAHQAAVAAAHHGAPTAHPAQARAGQAASAAPHMASSEPVRTSSGASAVGARRLSGTTRPAGTVRSSGASTAARPLATPTHLRPSGGGVPMRVIDDGPVTPQHRAAETPAHRPAPSDQAKPRTDRPRKPALVPEDGSRPPSTTPQEHF
jgi:rod shape-determining protein MreC